MGFSSLSMGYNKKTLSYPMPGPSPSMVHKRLPVFPRDPVFVKETSENWKMNLSAILKHCRFPALTHSVLGIIDIALA